MKGFLIGLILGFLILPLAGIYYFKFGNPPVAVGDKPFPLEREMVHAPLHARIAREMPKTVPMQPTPDNLLAGAQIYRQNCAACHGLYNSTSVFAQHMYPWAPQLWHVEGGADRVVGVSDDPPGETYWKVSNGIRLTGMPAFGQVLTPTEIWQVSLLLANADKPQPQPVMDILSKPLVY
ncbi:MAG TPA: cytochrome c [Acidobacteriaceae bacterium]|jgi:mono/diheme cytochrome c family protein|nr:cytochrome c [Acidobacteriaceae bacterium]